MRVEGKILVPVSIRHFTLFFFGAFRKNDEMKLVQKFYCQASLSRKVLINSKSRCKKEVSTFKISVFRRRAWKRVLHI